MAKCNQGLGPFYTKLTLLRQAADLTEVGSAARLFVDAIESQISTALNVGAVWSTTTLSCIEDPNTANFKFGEISDLTNRPLRKAKDGDCGCNDQKKEISKAKPGKNKASKAKKLALSETQTGIVVDIVNDDTKESCCAFLDSPVATGRRSVEFTLEVKGALFEASVALKFSITPSIAGFDKKGICRPPRSCKDESATVQILVVSKGSITIEFKKELVLPGLGDFGVGAKFKIDVDFADTVECILSC